MSFSGYPIFDAPPDYVIIEDVFKKHLVNYNLTLHQLYQPLIVIDFDKANKAFIYACCRDIYAELCGLLTHLQEDELQTVLNIQKQKLQLWKR